MITSFNFIDLRRFLIITSFDIFKDIRDKIELIFCNISPPQPKNIRRTTTRISSMENYYRNDSGCFDGNGMVAFFLRFLQII